MLRADSYDHAVRDVGQIVPYRLRPALPWAAGADAVLSKASVSAAQPHESLPTMGAPALDMDLGLAADQIYLSRGERGLRSLLVVMAVFMLAFALLSDPDFQTHLPFWHLSSWHLPSWLS